MKVVVTLAVLVVAAVVAALNVAVYTSAFSMLNEVLGSWVIQFIPEHLLLLGACHLCITGEGGLLLLPLSGTVFER